MKRQLLLVSLLTGLSQLAAFFKLWFTARVFGLDSSLDGYNLALVLPTLISGIMSGVLQTGFFPVRSQWAAQHNHDLSSVASFERTVLFGYAAFGLAVTVILAATTEYWTPLVNSNASPSARAAMQQAAVFTVWLICLNLIGDCTGFMLAMRDRFGIAAAAPIANGLFGGVLLGVWPEGGLSNLVAGTVLGLAIQVGICLIGLRSIGFRFFGEWPEYRLLKESLHKMCKLGGWILPGVVFSNIVVSLPPIWIASFGDGAVSAYGYAYRLHSSTLQLLVVAGSTVILARFSQLVVANNYLAVNSILKKASILSLLLGAGTILVIWNSGGSILQLVFDGRFNEAAAERVSKHWLWMTFGLGFAILGNVFAKLWQAQGRPQLISAFSALSLSTLTVSYYLLRGSLDEFALGASLSLSAAAVVLCGLRFLAPTTSRQQCTN